MNTDSANGIRHETIDALVAHGKVGDWAFDGANNQHLYLETPVGLALLPICENVAPDDEVKRPCWTWNGSLDAPTLSPSIRTWSTGREWHGWLRDGKMVSA